MAKPAKKAVESTEVATQSSAPAQQVGIDMSRFKVAKRITMPVFNPKTNEPFIVRIEDEMRTSTYSKETTDPKTGKMVKEKPATICTAVNMDTGEMVTWLIAEVVKKNLEESYPDAGYVGKIFAIQKLPKRPGKRYFDFEISELEENDEA